MPCKKGKKRISKDKAEIFKYFIERHKEGDVPDYSDYTGRELIEEKFSKWIAFHVKEFLGPELESFSTCDPYRFIYPSIRQHDLPPGVHWIHITCDPQMWKAYVNQYECRIVGLGKDNTEYASADDNDCMTVLRSIAIQEEETEIQFGLLLFVDSQINRAYICSEHKVSRLKAAEGKPPKITIAHGSYNLDCDIRDVWPYDISRNILDIDEDAHLFADAPQSGFNSTWFSPNMKPWFVFHGDAPYCNKQLDFIAQEYGGHKICKVSITFARDINAQNEKSVISSHLIKRVWISISDPKEILYEADLSKKYRFQFSFSSGLVVGGMLWSDPTEKWPFQARIRFLCRLDCYQFKHEVEMQPLQRLYYLPKLMTEADATPSSPKIVSNVWDDINGRMAFLELKTGKLRDAQWCFNHMVQWKEESLRGDFHKSDSYNIDVRADLGEYRRQLAVLYHKYGINVLNAVPHFLDSGASKCKYQSTIPDWNATPDEASTIQHDFADYQDPGRSHSASLSLHAFHHCMPRMLSPILPSPSYPSIISSSDPIPSVNDNRPGSSRVKKKSNKVKRPSRKHTVRIPKKIFAQGTRDKKAELEEAKDRGPVMKSPNIRKRWEYRLQVKWKKPSHAKMVKHFLLQMTYKYEFDPDWFLIGEFPQETLLYVVPDLLPGREYSFRVKCVFIDDVETPWSSPKLGFTDGEYDARHVQQEVKTNFEYREIAKKRREITNKLREEEERKEREREEEKRRKKRERAKAKRQRKKERKAEQRRKEEEKECNEPRRLKLGSEKEETKRYEAMAPQAAIKSKGDDAHQIRIQALKEERERLEKHVEAQRRQIMINSQPHEPNAATAPWSCKLCTFDNSVDSYWCEMCGQGTNPRPSKLALSQKQAREDAVNQRRKWGGMDGEKRGRASGQRGRGRVATGNLRIGRGFVPNRSRLPSRSDLKVVRKLSTRNTNFRDPADLSIDSPTLPQSPIWGNKKAPRKEDDLSWLTFQELQMLDQDNAIPSSVPKRSSENGGKPKIA